MKFRTKILLAIWGVVLGLLVVSDVVINYWIRVQIRSRFADDLRSNYTAVSELENLRFNDILRSCQISAESPRFKAVVEIGDYNTTLQLCEELNRSIKSDCFFFSGLKHQQSLQILEGNPVRIPPEFFPQTAAGNIREATADVWSWNGAVYRIATVPVMIGPDPVGTLAIGFKIQDNELAAIKAMTNSNVVLVVRDGVITGTLDSDRTAGLTAWLASAQEKLGNHRYRETPEVFQVETGNSRYAAVWVRLDRGTTESVSPAGFLFVKPIDSEVQAVLAPVERTFMYLSVVILVLTAGIGYVISKGISSPIAELVRGTSEISRGNYDHKIAVKRSGELGFLAGKFVEMSASLRDKISQLADRNEELEKAIRMLNETQAELVRSERLAATGKLTAQLSHEINNPVHNIQSCLQTVLKRTKPDSPGRELLEAAYEETGRLANLTRQMLDVYRMSVVPMDRMPVNVNDILDEIVQSSLPALLEKHISVDLRREPALPDIAGSRDKLKQVFLNLLVNARDAMPSGGTVTISTSNHNGNVIIRFADTGVGIAPEHMNKIFDAFFTTKSAVSGVGLGLTVSYGIVRQHDGTISVTSTPGAGTIFTCTFPLLKP